MQWYDISAEAPWLNRRDKYPEGNGLTGLFQGFASGYEVGQEAKERRAFNKGVDERSANAAAGSGGAGFGGVSGAARASMGMDKKIKGNFFTDMSRAYLGANMVPGSIEDVYKTQQAENQSLDIASKIETRNTALKIKGALLEFAKTFNEIGELEDGWANPEADTKLGAFAMRHPYIMESPLFQKTQDWIKNAQMAKSRTAQLENQNLRLIGTVEHQANMTELAQQRLALEQQKLDAGKTELEAKLTAKENETATLEEGRNKRAEMASGTRIEVQRLRNLSRIDPKTGKVITEGEFVNRHLNQLMRNEGISEVEAVQRLKSVYHLENLGATPQATPAPDASNALMDAFKAWIENKKKQ